MTAGSPQCLQFKVSVPLRSIYVLTNRKRIVRVSLRTGKVLSWTRISSRRLPVHNFRSVFVDKQGLVWAPDDCKNIWVFDPVRLTLRNKISLAALLGLKEKVQVELFAWTLGRTIVFDKVSGMGAVFSQMKQVLRFREFLGTRA